MLDAAVQAASASLRFKLGDVSGPGIYTLTTGEGDVLVARWSGADSSRPERAIWLWDTPSFTTFVADVDPSILQPSTPSR